MPVDSPEFSATAPRPSPERHLVDADSVTSLADALRVLLFRTRERGGRPPDRRASPRVEAEVTCVELVEGTRYLLNTHDLSVFGLSTKDGHSHPIGTEVRLEVRLPDEDASQPFAVRARVVGHNPSMGGMRMAFRSPSREAVRRLHRFVVKRAEQTSAG